MRAARHTSACNERQQDVMLRYARQLRWWLYLSSPLMVVLLALGNSAWTEKLWLGAIFGLFNLALYAIVRLTEQAQPIRPTNTGLDVLAYIEH